jgi:NADH-quinone oxidoreductase subunit H
LFLGGWLPPLNIEPFTGVWPHLASAGNQSVSAAVYSGACRRAGAYRYGQLMRLGWKAFLPFSLIWLVGTAIVLVVMGWLPALPAS